MKPKKPAPQLATITDAIMETQNKVFEALAEAPRCEVPPLDVATNLNAFITAIQYVDAAGNRDAQIWNAAVQWAWSEAFKAKAGK
jgi:hypothetical protein